MRLLSKYKGIPTTEQDAIKQLDEIVNEEGIFCFSFMNKGYYAVKKIERGLYKGYFGVYQYATRPANYIKLIRI